MANRLAAYTDLPSVPLYHPCPEMDRFYSGEYGDYILMPSRINPTKRQKLAIEALAKTKKDVKIFFLGRADNEYTMNEMRTFLKERKLEDRVKFLGFVEKEEKLRLYANARAVLFIPKDEDYGYITLEAMSASRPVITATDSGGPLEFVEDRKNGWITEPTPEAIAEALDEAAGLETQARTWGKEARKHLDEMDITWKHVVKELTRP